MRKTYNLLHARQNVRLAIASVALVLGMAAFFKDSCGKSKTITGAGSYSK